MPPAVLPLQRDHVALILFGVVPLMCEAATGRGCTHTVRTNMLPCIVVNERQQIWPCDLNTALQKRLR